MRLDPRTKLYFLLLTNLALFFHMPLSAEIWLTASLLALLFLAGKTKTGMRMTVLYGVLVGFDLWVIPVVSGVAANFIAMFSVGIRMMLPCLIAGSYAFSTTTVGEMVCGLRKLHVPESVIIPCVTVARFFPTIGEDYRQIRNAMAFRGIAAGNGAMLRHPAQSLEYILIPLLMNSNTVAQDLSVAAMTKGIGLPGRHTCMTELKLTIWDLLCMLWCTAPFLLVWGGKLA